MTDYILNDDRDAKDILIEKTCAQVLDRVAKEFPDQIAFKYTTLDYTRTYAEFRDEVDLVARALLSVGVKSGDHVAVWATNVPEWYLVFWATTKIGAVLVSVNTAYKSHEIEYLLRQSDTHTLFIIDGYRDSNYAEIINELCPELKTNKKGSTQGRLRAVPPIFPHSGLSNILTYVYGQNYQPSFYQLPSYISQLNSRLAPTAASLKNAPKKPLVHSLLI